jgi:hypothetical protein
MNDKPTLKDRLGQYGHRATPPDKKDVEAEEVSCPAFGYLRGIRDRATTLELRFRNGNSMWFPYGWMAPCHYDRSEGILLKFSGDLVYLVLIRGSNLDLPINGHMNLTTGGLQRQRVTWISEMPDEDIKRVGEKAPTIDSIEVAEFESHAELKVWLGKHAPVFVK